MQRTAPRWETTTTASDRTDLRCTICGKTIAYGISADRAAAEAPFFLDAHQPFCYAVG